MIAARIMISLCLLLYFLGSTSASHDDRHRDWEDICDDKIEYICNKYNSHHPCCDRGMTDAEIIITVLSVVAVIVVIILVCLFWSVCPFYKMRHSPRGGKVYATSPQPASSPQVATTNQTVMYSNYQQQPGQQPVQPIYAMPSDYQYPPQQVPASSPQMAAVTQTIVYPDYQQQSTALPEAPPAYSPPKYN